MTCSATVTVTATPPTPPAPTCSISVDPITIARGNSSTLSWTSTNVTSVMVDNGIGSVNPNGSVSISPNDATTYTGTFTGTEGTITCSVSISVTSGGCTENCGGGGGGGGGGGSNPPTVSLSGVSSLLGPITSFVYLNQVPYTGLPGEDIVVKKVFFIAN